MNFGFDNKPTVIPDAPYKVYTILLSQTGTDDPVANELQNTIGTIGWTRDSTGFYRFPLPAISDISKTFIIVPGNSGGGVSQHYTGVFDDETGFGIVVKSYVDTTISDDILNNTPIEIRVYP